MDGDKNPNPPCAVPGCVALTIGEPFKYCIVHIVPANRLMYANTVEED